MAWKLRQPFEGDRIITVNDVPDSAECWVDGGGVYVPDSIAIEISGVEYILNTVEALDVGFLIIEIPSGVYITATTTIKVYAVCETSVDSTTVTLTAKPVDFQVYSGVINSCNPQVILNSDLNEYVRFYLSDAAGDFFTAAVGASPLQVSNFSYQSEDSGNIASTGGGTFSRPSTFGSAATLISNSIYAGTPILSITVLSTTKYFTARLGYIELIFNGGTLLYNNYMIGSEFEVAGGTYILNDVYTIEATNSAYIVRKNGTVLFTKNKNISYTVSGGTVVPSTSTVGTPVAWNIPGSPGDYTFTGTLGDNIIFRKTVTLRSCANAINDGYTGIYNAVFSGDVSTNDTACVGENTFYQLSSSPSPIGGTPVVAQDGTFTFTPTTNFNGAATFNYDIKCGSTFGASEIIDSAVVTINYFNACNGVVASWVATGNTRCFSCTEQKEERDINAQCTGNANRWVTNAGGSACSITANLVPTGLTRCQSCVNEKEVQDLNTCSATYLAKSWILDPTGTLCDSVPNWVDNGTFRCNNCVEEKQQTDNKGCSPTFNTSRWVGNTGGTQCNRDSVWVDTGDFLCSNCVEYKRQNDTNSCSATFNQTRNVVNPGGSVCDTDATWVDTGVTRCEENIHQKLQSSINSCSEESERWVATGLDLCDCLIQTRFRIICNPDETIVGVEVKKQGVVESNRLISFTNDLITFKADAGVATYIIKATTSNDIVHKITHKEYSCTPII